MMADRTGQKLGNYRLLRLIGGGGFAKVYLGEHIYLKSYAALKVPKMQLTREDVEEFLTEARTSVGLDHPHIIRVLECGVEDGMLPYLVMSYAPGGTLRQRYPKGSRLQPATILAYVKQVASALQYIHNKGLIHQDIKPENMLLGRNDEVMLSDFGIAVVAHRTITMSIQEVTGTAWYMAPEQFVGKARPASDQYALAVVVYEWICGAGPFDGSFSQLYSKHLFTPPPPLNEKVPGIPLAVEQVILKALAKEPQYRFATVMDFANALEQAIQVSQISPPPPEADPTMWAKTLKVSPPTPPPDSPMYAETLKQVGQTPPQGSYTLFPGQAATALPPLYGPSSPDPTLLANIPGQVGQTPPASYPAHYLPPRKETEKVVPRPIVSTPPVQERVVGKSNRRGFSRSVAVSLVVLVLLVVVGSVAFLFSPVFKGKNAPPSTTQTPTAHAVALAPPYSATFGFNLQHTHYNPSEAILSPANVSHLVTYWKASTTSSIYSEPSVSGGVVYVSSTDRKLYAFDAATGKLRWTVTTGSPAAIGSSFYSSPTVVGNLVYIGSEDGNLYAFDARTGTRMWKAPTAGAIFSSPAVAGDLAYIGSLDHNLYAFNARTGAQIWKASTGNAIYSSPAVAGGVVYVGSNDSLFYAFNATTGAQLWTARTGYHINTSPAVAGNVVYIGSDDSSVYAFQTAGCGRPPCANFWAAPTQGYIFSSPAVANGVVYIGSHDGKLYALDAMTGTILWTITTGGDIVSSPGVANGVVYVGSFDHKLYALSATTGAILWTYTTGDRVYSSPTVVDGVVYVGSQDHQLYAFHLS